jgi:signal transduction histidine kinase/two-component SAPR family response regulator
MTTRHKHSDPTASQANRLARYFPGETEMAQRMRELDWSKTPLGPVESWPQALRTEVSTCLDCAFPIIIWWGPELVILYNDEYLPMLGPTKHPSALGERGGKVWAEIWDVIGPMLSQVLERGEATRSRDLLLHINRGYPEEAYFSFSYSPIHQENGEVGGVFCPVIETTGKVIGERRLRTLRDLAAKCKGSVREDFVYQSASEVLASNPQDLPFVIIYGIDDEQSVASLKATAGISQGNFAAPLSVELKAGEPVIWSLNTVAHSGEILHLDNLEKTFDSLPTGAWKVPVNGALVLPVLLPGQDRPRAIIVAAVSPMRALDEDYRTFFGLIATQIASGIADAQALESERQRAEALAEIDRVKTTFFNNVSHEFRTPLTLMLGPLEELLEGARDILPNDLFETLNVARRNSLRLLKLVNTLLDFARIEAGRVDANYESTDIAAITAELTSTFHTAVERAGLHLTFDCSLLPRGEAVFVDREMWEKIVLNLISNAFKFTFEGRIAVALRLNAEFVELDVSDTGIGISESDLPVIFQRFHRIKNARSRTIEGTGIGLALVQELAHLHGGEVTVQSKQGSGSTFTVRIKRGTDHLPPDRIRAARSLASTNIGRAEFVDEAMQWLPDAEECADKTELRSEGQSDSSAMTIRRSGATARILIADDNADMRGYLHRILSKEYSVTAVADGEAALRSIELAPPDLLLTDVMMPRLDGFGLLAAIRGNERTRTIPVIMLSARAGENSVIEGLSAAADEYLSKPFSARELLARVASQLHLARVRQETEKLLRYHSERFEALLNNAPLGVYLVDADFCIAQMNPAALPSFSNIPGGAIGRDFADIMHILLDQTDADEIVRIFRHTLATGESYLAPERSKFRVDRGITEYYEWRLDRITLPDGRYGLVCYFRDISSYVQTRDELREADRKKDEFLAILAHELRGPLAPLRNTLEIIKHPGSNHDQRNTAADILERQLSQMTRLVDDLLDVGRITRDSIELRKARVNLNSIVQRAVETCTPIIERSNHKVTISLSPEPTYLHADPIRLAQVFSNLLHNACKYTEPGGQIWLTAYRQGNLAVVSVKDSGIGIPADSLDTIFQMFTQVAKTMDRSDGGLGIGLMLVRRLVEMHGGTVTAHSEGMIGRGSEFIVQLPVPAVVATEVSEIEFTEIQQRSAKEPYGRRILVVDDNRDSAESLAMLLSAMGNETQLAYDGIEALEKVQRFKPHVVFLDIGLPNMNGYDTCSAIRRTVEVADILIIAMTGWGQEQDRKRSKEAGFDAHLVKPVDLENLVRILETRDGSTTSDGNAGRSHQVPYPRQVQ